MGRVLTRGRGSRSSRRLSGVVGGGGCWLVGKDSIYLCLPVDAFRFTKNLAYFTYVLY